MASSLIYIYDWYRNQTWLQEIALTYDASSHGGDKYEKVKRPYGIVHDVVNDMILWTDAGTGHVVRSDVHGMHGAETPRPTCSRVNRWASR